MSAVTTLSWIDYTSSARAELGIARSLEEFFKPENENLNLEVRSVDANDDEVTCNFK